MLKALLPFVGLTLLLPVNEVVAKEKYNTDWTTSICAEKIGDFMQGKVSDVRRLMVDERNGDDHHVRAIIGDPNKPGVIDQSESEFFANIEIDKHQELGRVVLGVTYDGYTAFRLSGTKVKPTYDQSLYYEYDGECVFMRPAGHTSKNELPKSTQTYFDKMMAENPDWQQDKTIGTIAAADRKGRDGIQTDDDFDTAIDRQEQENAIIRSLKGPMLAAAKQLLKECEKLGTKDANIDRKFVTQLDIDGDGDLDWIMDTDHFFCRLPSKNGVNVHGLNGIVGGLGLIFSNTPNGLQLTAKLFTLKGEISQFKGYAVYSGYGPGETTGELKFAMIRNGKMNFIDAMPQGGKVIYRFARD
jgi:hypothetical protein